jgi:hypothetical protein
MGALFKHIGQNDMPVVDLRIPLGELNHIQTRSNLFHVVFSATMLV